MKFRWMVSVAVAVAAVAGSLSCRQSSLKTLTIHVPQMADAVSIRIVTNAALNEVAARHDAIAHGVEVDLVHRQIVYHEGRRLLDGNYLRRIEACLAQVGLPGKAGPAQLNPPPPYPTPQGPVQLWPDRYTVTIAVPDMTSRTAANIAVDAIAYARLGKDDPRVQVHAPERQLVVTYESLDLAPMNIELAIACAGFQANDVLARLGNADAPPHDWRDFPL